MDAHTAGGRLLFLLDEHRQRIFEGRAFAAVAPLLDGHHDLAAIVEAVGADVPLPEIYQALDRLERSGCLAEGGTLPAHAGWQEYQRPRPVTAAGSGLPRVRVRSLGGMDTSPLLQALNEDGFEVSDEADVELVLTDDYLRPELEAINTAALSRQQPWLLVKPTGAIAWLGPLLVPGQTGCWSCMAQRLRANRQMQGYLQERRGSTEPFVAAGPSLPATIAMTCELATGALAEWAVAPSAARLTGNLITLDLVSRESREHVLIKRPQCPACGEPARASEPGAVRLSSVAKRHRGDGGHRTLTPEQTYERYRHHISPLLGAVTELAPALGSHSELTHSYVAGHNFSMGVDSIVFLQESLRGMSGGKGATRIQAMVSGLCEAIERYSGLYWGDEPRRRASYRSLGESAIHPNACMGFSETQFEQREAWNAAQLKSRCHLVPNPFDEEATLDWSPLWSLSDETVKYLPTAYCYYGHPEFRQGLWCAPDSNGAAAGNTLEEAVFQGFLELVERDAVALWWYNRVPREALDLDSFKLPYVDAIREHYAGLERELWVLDISSDLDIHTFACVSRRIDKPVEDILLGFGSHLAPDIALLRAITEVNQFLPSVSLANPDGSTRYLFGDELARHWWTNAKLAEQPYLAPAAGAAPRPAHTFRDHSSDDLLDDVEHCLALARDAGMEVLVLDQTRPDIGLSVVKVVVPELCHFWRRLGKPRLYQVPVKMGWQDRPLTEDAVNPHSIFF